METPFDGSEDEQILSALWTAQAASFPKLPENPQDAHQGLMDQTAEVADAERVYSIYQASRRFRYMLLVER
jgi:hypothetical protein